MRIMATTPVNFNQKPNKKNNQTSFGMTIKGCGGYLKPEQEIEYLTKLANDVEQGIFSKLMSKSYNILSVANPEETKQLIIVGDGINYEYIQYNNHEINADEFGSWITKPDMFDPPATKKIIAKIKDNLNINIEASNKKKNESKILPFNQFRA